MLKCKLIIIGIIILAITSAVALAEQVIYGLCADDTIFVQAGTNSACTIITPVLTSRECSSFTYNITQIPQNTKVVENGNLAELNDSRYFFNFTQGKGNYTITLCDGSSQDKRVLEVDDMIEVLYLVLGLSAFLLALSVIFEQKTLAWLGGLLMFISGIWVIIHGVGGHDNFLTYAFGVVLFGVGAFLFIAVSLSWISDSGV